MSRCDHCGREDLTLRSALAILAEAHTVPILRVLGRIEQKEITIMGAIEDLKAVDAELAATVTDLAGTIGDVADDVDRLDGDFVKLQQAVEAGDTDAINAEVANLRTLVDSAKASADRARAAKASIDATDPAAPPADGGSTPPADGTQPPADTTPVEGDGSTPTA